MNSSFLFTLLAVLSDEEDIPSLPTNMLIATSRKGERINAEVSEKVLLKLARLQTLCFKAHETGEMPDLNTVKQVASETGSEVTDAMANSLGIQEDMTRRVMMLERLIVEVIREAIPAECDKTDVEYNVHVSGAIVRRPVEHCRFLD